MTRAATARILCLCSLACLERSSVSQGGQLPLVIAYSGQRAPGTPDGVFFTDPLEGDTAGDAVAKGALSARSGHFRQAVAANVLATIR